MGNNCDCLDSGGSERDSSDSESDTPRVVVPQNDNQFPFVSADHRIHNINSLFTLEKELGKGASCRVLRVIRKSDQKRFAMKEMKIDDKWNPMLFEQEVRILQKIRDHPNILKYVDCYMDRSNFYILTDLCTGGELFDKIKELRHFPEREARAVIKVVLDAIGYCHSHDIVHRDLKPENMVYKSDKQVELVIIDFGDAKEVQEQDVHEDFVGTAFYLAPESIRNRRGWELKRSDMWTIGVITYVLVTGRPPFWGRNNKEILKRILRCRVNFPSTIKISRTCKDFIMALLQSQPDQRLTAEQALKHPWITGEASDNSLSESVLLGLASFASSNKLKKLLVRTVAENLDSKRRRDLESQFIALDINGDGRIDINELTQFLVSNSKASDENVAKVRAKNVIEKIAGKGRRRMTLEDWSHSSVAKLLSSKALIKRQYQKLDVDGDGFISTDDLLAIFEGATTEEVMSIIQEVDLNKDGRISPEEFGEAMSFHPAYTRE